MLRISTGIAVALIGAGGLRADPAQVSFQKEILPLLENYCFNCHESSKAKGEVNLESITAEGKFWSNPKLWERVLMQVRDKTMPPPKRSHPSEEEHRKLVGWLEHTLANPDPAQFPRDPGQKVIHRLSRREYNHTVQDLLGVDLSPADDFPPDGGGGGGFDNNAGSLFVPPVLVERYLMAADQLIAAARPERLFAKRPGEGCDERAAARQSIEAFASRAFRRPVVAEETERLLALYDAARNRGEAWEGGVKAALKAALISPHFLFRIEAEQPVDGPYRVSDFELASRLSYFLWSSMPDDELFRLAGENKLHEPATLEAQVKRMLQDPKARRFAENFASQWLRTKEVHTNVNPARHKYPNFNEELRAAMYAEPVEFFHALMRENRPLTECLDADYTFANEVLAKLYGIEGVQGPEMRRVKLTDRNRGGVVTMAGVLAITSYPARPSPVLRGKWVMEEILGTPPPPPPPLVNSQALASERPRDGMTFRQRLERHRADPKCAGCHARMDPLGFGLDNFDVVGGWRTEISKTPIDPSGKLPTGEQFNGPAEMKAVLLGLKNDFLKTLTEKMLAYSLGRGIEPADWITVHQIRNAVAQDGFRSQRLALEIAKSFPFQHRRNQTGKKTASIQSHD